MHNAGGRWRLSALYGYVTAPFVCARGLSAELRVLPGLNPDVCDDGWFSCEGNEMLGRDSDN